MFKWAKDISAIAQGIAAIVFLYTVFFPRTTGQPQDGGALVWTPMMWSALALGVAVLSGVVLNSISVPKQSDWHGLRIVSARWYCTVKGVSKDVTKAIQGKVIGESVRIHAHDNVLGDVCKLHDGTGDPKTLEVEFVYRSHATATHDEWLSIPCPENSTHELRLELERTTRDLEVQRLTLLDWKKTSEGTTVEFQALSRELKELSELNAKLTESRGKLSTAERDQIKRAGVLMRLADDADSMNAFLEKIWHLYNEDKQQTEGALICPLSAAAIPDDIKEWRHKELWRFRALYRAHIQAVKETDADSQTNVIDLGFPCDGLSYLEVRRNLSNHAGFLRDRASRLLSPFVAVAETR